MYCCYFHFICCSYCCCCCRREHWQKNCRVSLKTPHPFALHASAVERSVSPYEKQQQSVQQGQAVEKMAQ